MRLDNIGPCVDDSTLGMCIERINEAIEFHATMHIGRNTDKYTRYGLAPDYALQLIRDSALESIDVDGESIDTSNVFLFKFAATEKEVAVGIDYDRPKLVNAIRSLSDSALINMFTAFNRYRMNELLQQLDGAVDQSSSPENIDYQKVEKSTSTRLIALLEHYTKWKQ